MKNSDSKIQPNFVEPWQRAGIYPDRLMPIHAGSPDILASWDSDKRPMIAASFPKHVTKRPEIIQTQNLKSEWIEEPHRNNLIITLTANEQSEKFFKLGHLLAEVLVGLREEMLLLQFTRELSEWSHLLRPAGRGLSFEQKVGLAAELSVLKDDLLEVYSPAEALQFWVGPSGAPADITLPGLRIETKGCVPSKKERIHISSLQQLEAGNSCLALLQVVIDAESLTGTTLQTLIDELIDIFKIERPLSIIFEKKISRFTTDARQHELEEFRFRRAEFRYWEVDSNFPSLTPSTVGSAVVAANYELDVNQIQEHLGSEYFHDFIRRHSPSRSQ